MTMETTSDRHELTAVAPSVPAERGAVDLVAAELAAADFLAALDVDLGPEGLRETPARMARAYAELFAPQPFELTTFPNDEGYDELVLARAIPFRTVCEHHLLPFAGVTARRPAIGATTLTSMLLGTLRTDHRSRAEFLALVGAPA